MSSFTTLLFQKQGAVTHISLNRPQVLNAYNLRMRDDLSQALAAVRDDSEVRALLITGEGRAFCAGADLTEFGTAPSQIIARRVRWQRDLWGQMLALPQPVVVAVHGYCVGSGVEIALLGDIRIAAAGTQFALPEVQLGMIPAAGGTQTLPRHLGPATALDLLYTGRYFSAREAYQLGLVTRLSPDDQLNYDAWQLVRQLATVEYSRLVAAKTALRQGQDLPLADGLRQEHRLASQIGGEA